MKIVCPSCQAQYEVPESVLTSRRKMRCARCGGEWVPGDAAPAAPEAVAESVPVVAVQPPHPGPAEPALPPAPPVAETPAHEDVLADMAEPDLSWLALEEEPELPSPAAEPLSTMAEPVVPPPIAIAPEKPLIARPTLPNPAAIVIPPRAPGPPVLAWVFSLVLLAGLGASAVIFRAPIMKAWPPSTRVYAGLGLVEK